MKGTGEGRRSGGGEQQQHQQLHVLSVSFKCQIDSSQVQLSRSILRFFLAHPNASLLIPSQKQK
jgi:hypothetical protein